MRYAAILSVMLILSACGPRDPGTESEAEAEALNQAAAELEAQAPPPVKADGAK
jgi:hypothetical protein